MVGTRKKQSVTGGGDRSTGGVPSGDTVEDGEPSEGVGTGEGGDVGEQLPDTGRGTGTTTRGGRGVSGAAGAGEQQPDTGKGKRGGPSSFEAGTTGAGQDGGGGSGTELGGLSDLNLVSLVGYSSIHFDALL